jgi:hypothetical protein
MLQSNCVIEGHFSLDSEGQGSTFSLYVGHNIRLTVRQLEVCSLEWKMFSHFSSSQGFTGLWQNQFKLMVKPHVVRSDKTGNVPMT